jgi:uncharacterized protein (DUF2164 family)
MFACTQFHLKRSKREIMQPDLSKQEKDNAIRSIQRFFEEEMETDIGDLQATLMFEFFSKELAPLAYNRGIDDAKHFLQAKAEDLVASCYEKPFSYWAKK